MNFSELIVDAYIKENPYYSESRGITRDEMLRALRIVMETEGDDLIYGRLDLYIEEFGNYANANGALYNVVAEDIFSFVKRKLRNGE
jgi:hypothetical protein